MSEIFANVPVIKYEGPESKNPLSFKYYDADRVILGMDAFALGLIKAAKLIEDGRIDAFIEERYASYKTGIGAKIRSGEAALEELAAYAAEMGAPANPGSGRQEYLESIVNQVIFG